MKPLDPKLLKHAKDARSYIVFLVVAGTLSAALVLAQSYFISAAASPVIEGTKTLAEVTGLIAALAGVFLARVVVTFLIEAFGHRAALRTIRDLRTQVLRRAGDAGDRWLSDGNTTSTVTLVTEALDDLEPYFVKYLPQLFLVSTVTPLTLAVIFWTDWISAVAIIVCLPLIPIFMILVGKQTSEYSSKRIAAMQKLGQQLIDLLSGLPTLKALGREQGPRGRVAELGDNFASTTMRTLRVAFLSGAVLEFLATLSTAIVAVEVGLRMVAGHIGLFEGLLIIMLTPEAFKPLREVGSQFHASSDGVAAAEKVFAVLEVPVPASTGTADAPDLNVSPIEIHGLSVKAPGRATIAPSKLEARIEPGSVTVLRGRSGSGKSTTVDVLLGLVEPDAGEILIGGTPLADIRRESLWEQITWVPQRPAIVPGTVLENIGTELSPQLEQAASQTGFADIVASLPEGWATRIGQGGTGLSVGQRQRLALTRALVTPNPLVILDEPSAHLDAMSEQAVASAVQALREAGHTVLVIAHRTALFSLADSVIDVRASADESLLAAAPSSNLRPQAGSGKATSPSPTYFSAPEERSEA